MKLYKYKLGNKELCSSTSPVEFSKFFPSLKKTEIIEEVEGKDDEKTEKPSKKKKSRKDTTEKVEMYNSEVSETPSEDNRKANMYSESGETIRNLDKEE